MSGGVRGQRWERAHRGFDFNNLLSSLRLLQPDVLPLCGRPDPGRGRRDALRVLLQPLPFLPRREGGAGQHGQLKVSHDQRRRRRRDSRRLSARRCRS